MTDKYTRERIKEVAEFYDSGEPYEGDEEVAQIIRQLLEEQQWHDGKLACAEEMELRYKEKLDMAVEALEEIVTSPREKPIYTYDNGEKVGLLCSHLDKVEATAKQALEAIKAEDPQS